MCNYVGSFTLVSWVVSDKHCYYRYGSTYSSLGAGQGLLAVGSKPTGGGFKGVSMTQPTRFLGVTGCHKTTESSFSLLSFPQFVITQPHSGPFSAVSVSSGLLGPLTFCHH